MEFRLIELLNTCLISTIAWYGFPTKLRGPGVSLKTSLLRHAFVEIPAVSVVKVEMLEKSVTALNNEFMVTFFTGNTLYDKKFIFKANSISEENTEEVPILFVEGVIER